MKILIKSSEKKKISKFLRLSKSLVCSMCVYVQCRQHYFTKIKDALPPITRRRIMLNKYYSLGDIMSESTNSARLSDYSNPPISNIWKKNHYSPVNYSVGTREYMPICHKISLNGKNKGS